MLVKRTRDLGAVGVGVEVGSSKKSWASLAV